MRLFRRKAGGTFFGKMFRAATSIFLPTAVANVVNTYINPTPKEDKEGRFF